jgi:arylsulfatase A-like enzyme
MSAPGRTLLLALLCTACAGGKPAKGVTHLDPRLESGQSSADVLAAMGIEWSQVTELDDPTAVLGPWELLFAERLPTESGRGVFLRGNVVLDRPPGAREGRVERVLLAATETIDAAELNVFEVDVVSSHNGVAKLSWTNEKSAGEHSISVRFDASSTAAPVRLSPAGHREWVGRISDLRIAPMEEGRQRFELHAVRGGWVAFTPGADPLEGDQGDGGLIALGFEARRVWPTDFEVPLYDRCVVPAGGRLVVEVALAGTSGRLSGTVDFLVDVKTGKGGWKNVLARDFGAGEMASASRWRVLVCDLARYGGRTLDLRLRTVLGELGSDIDAGTDGRLERARVYWGNPIVLGALAADRRPNIVLVTLDTTRADAVGALPGQESRTPFLDRIGREGFTFTNAWTTCNSTSPAHVSIMTGLALQDHGVLNNREVLSSQATTLAERLRAEGYHTAAAVSASHLQAGYSGLGQGMDQFLMADPAAALDGGITVDAVETWLHRWREGGERPVFLWVHLFDAHTPYGPPEEFLSGYLRRYQRPLPSRYSHPPSLPSTRWSSPGEFLEDVTNRRYAEFLYGSGVAYADQLTDRLWAAVEATAGRESSALVVTADHGESLGERGLWYLHRGLFPEVMHVPLIVRLPRPVARKVQALASVIDIPTTILSYLGLSAHEGLRGRDLLEAAGGADWSDRRIWLEHSDLVQVACRDTRFHFIHTLEPFDLRESDEILPAGQTQLFRVAEDSNLDVDVGRELPGRLAGYEKLLTNWRASALGANSTRRATTPEEESRLRQLGYVDGG